MKAEVLETIIDLAQDREQFIHSASYRQETLDMIFDSLVKCAEFNYKGELRFYPDSELIRILEYRHPDEFHEAVRDAKEALEKKKEEEERPVNGTD